jgi:hypothetical protein
VIGWAAQHGAWQRIEIQHDLYFFNISSRVDLVSYLPLSMHTANSCVWSDWVMSVAMRCVRETLTRGCMLQSYVPISQGTVKHAQPQPLVQQCWYQERKNVCSNVQIYLSVSRLGEARDHCKKLSPWTQGGHATIVASSLSLDALQVILSSSLQLTHFSEAGAGDVCGRCFQTTTN